MHIYLWLNEQQVGPYTIEEIQARLSSGMLQASDLAWTEAQRDRRPVSELVPPAISLKASSHEQAKEKTGQSREEKSFRLSPTNVSSAGSIGTLISSVLVLAFIGYSIFGTSGRSPSDEPTRVSEGIPSPPSIAKPSASEPQVALEPLEWARSEARRRVQFVALAMKNPEKARIITIERGPVPPVEQFAAHSAREDFPGDEAKQKWFCKYVTAVTEHLVMNGTIVLELYGERGVEKWFNYLQENPAELEKIAKEAPPVMLKSEIFE